MLAKTVSDMQSVIGRLEDGDWSMYNMNLETSAPRDNNGEVIFDKLIFYFSKPDQKTGKEFKYPTKDEVAKIFNDWGLDVDDLDFRERAGEGEMIVDFSSRYLHGEIPDSIEKCFNLVCDRFGFDGYSWDKGRLEVFFLYEI